MQNCISLIEHKTDAMYYSMHTHTGCQMLYVKKGCIGLQIANEKYEAHAPCFIVINNLEPHAIRTIDSISERFIFYINNVAAQKILKNRTLMSVFSTGHNSRYIIDITGNEEKFESIVRLIYGIFDEHSEHYENSINLAFNLLLLQLLDNYPEYFDSFETRIQKAVWDIKHELEESPQEDIHIKNFAQKYHFSEYYLAHSFQKITGYGIKQYQMLCRIAFASELLIDADKSITEIAFDSGFADASNFARYFKQQTGISPSDFREKHKGNLL